MWQQRHHCGFAVCQFISQLPNHHALKQYDKNQRCHRKTHDRYQVIFHSVLVVTVFLSHRPGEPLYNIRFFHKVNPYRSEHTGVLRHCSQVPQNPNRACGIERSGCTIRELFFHFG
jgi:hypothetical protein